jgi:primosomal protein N' (replication factor Y)
VAAIDRAFDYVVPPALAADVRVGVIVRVPLHGRRVKGWVLETDVEPETTPDKLVEITKIVSAGPPSDLVDLCTWAAWRWAGPRAVFLRAASPPQVVAPGPWPDTETAVYPPIEAPLPLSAAAWRTVRWPPASSRTELVHALVDAEGSTIVVAPDPREDGALVRALEAQGRHVLVWRAHRPPKERSRSWDVARRGACVVIGGRSAVFAPVPDLSAVVLLDDADEALKEERAPTWHARDLAAERARRAGARFDVVSPAPTVEALTLTGPASTPPHTSERAGWPRVELVDLRAEPPGARVLSEGLGAVLARALEQGARAVCVLNRRGRARLLACRTCRELARCARCGAAVAKETDQLICPRCDEPHPPVCLHCGSGAGFGVVRPGVVGVREQLGALVPRARVVAVDTASAPLPAFDIAVGTEAVLHRVRPDAEHPVRLVVFLELDQELLAPRYRAGEQALWLLVRAARLLGPRDDGGVLLLQTRVPEDPIVVAVRDAEPGPVEEVERRTRETLRFPPFGGLAEVAGAEPAVRAACDALGEAVEVLGPERGRALLRAPTTERLCDALSDAPLGPARALRRFRIDVDPLRV